LIREVKPGYTSDAMRARIQGTVRLQAIVAADGSVSAARVVRSLDDRFGLDQEAVKTVKQWRFLPGTLAGRPVPVLIEIELTFTLR
jgi:protein TonB